MVIGHSSPYNLVFLVFLVSFGLFGFFSLFGLFGFFSFSGSSGFAFSKRSVPASPPFCLADDPANPARMILQA